MSARLAASVAGGTRRVLIVSFWFPPFHTIAALRMGKLAKRLRADGWDVRVLAADETDEASIPLEIPRADVLYAPWVDVDRTLQAVLTRLRKVFGRPTTASAEVAHEGDAVTQPPPGKPPIWRKALRQAYLELVRLPDNRAGWIRPALEAGDKLITTWRPDVIYATSPPPTSLIVADRLSRKHRIPWVAEFRDLWSDHPYYEYSVVRRFFERRWDQRVLTRAAAIVTVSPVWEPQIAARYGRPTLTAMNGFVLEDLPECPPVEPETTGPLRIVYTGHIYPGRRDPTPLFDALRRLRVTSEDVIVEFVGTGVEDIHRLADAGGVRDLVRIRRAVSHRESLSVQMHADVLLHLQWCDPKEAGTIAGKIFDYLGSRRPVLGIALENSVVAKLIYERKAGLVTNDPSKIAKQVAVWIREKRAGGVLPLPPTASDGLDRESQFAKVADLLSNIVDETLNAPASAVRS